MNVRELIRELHGINEDFEVVAYSRDRELCARGHGDRVLEVVGVSVDPGASGEAGDDLAGLEYAKGGLAERIATIAVAIR